MRKRVLTAGVAALACLLATTGTAAAAPRAVHPAAATTAVAGDAGGLLALTFSNNTMRLLAATSADGTALSPAPGQVPYADPGGRGVRDPSVVRSGGRFVAAYTSAPPTAYLAAETSWSLAVSTDVNHWSYLTDVSMTAIPGVTHVWAPDLFVDDDGSVYSYVSASTDGASTFQTYVLKALDATMTQWSAPTLVSGLGPNTIDATVRRVGADYVMFVKDETNATIGKAHASSPMGPFTMDQTGDWMGIGNGVEGPALVTLPDGRYRLYYDAYVANQLRYVDSADLQTWSAPRDLGIPWPLARHLGLLWLTSGELAAVRASAPHAPDLTGDGNPDVLARQSNGLLWLYPGNGRGGVQARRLDGRGWNIFNTVVNAGDFTGDGAPDVLGRQSNGLLWLYPGNGRGGWQPRRLIGRGWNNFNSVLDGGDLTGDGNPDVLARQSNGILWAYPGDGHGGFQARRYAGSGWNGLNALANGGDLTGDGNPDLLARQSNGILWIYPGDGHGGFQARRDAGSGWNGFSAIVGAGDMTADGAPDVLARDWAGRMWLYPGDGRGGWQPRLLVGSGWNIFTALP